MKQHLVVLTGAGMSAESGLRTFRDSDGLWEGHDVMQVASPEGFADNPELVLEFYNQRRKQLKEVEPNAAHTLLAELEQDYRIDIITQNVDDLHERAGSNHVLHLHGELLKARSTQNEGYVVDWHGDMQLGDLDPDGHQMRPHIVWFGEMVPLLNVAAEICARADRLLIIGTSMQVYPAAGLMHEARFGTPIYYIDPKPSAVGKNVQVIQASATEGMQRFVALAQHAKQNDLIQEMVY